METSVPETGSIAIRPLTRDDAPAWRVLRLEALTNHPEAFSSSHEEFGLLDAEAVAARIPEPGDDDVLFGVFDGDDLCGCAGFVRGKYLKGRHKGMMVGVYLRANLRGKSVGDALVERVIEQARRHVDMLTCSVHPDNLGARALYLRHGFVVYGREPRALRTGGRDHDEELMALVLSDT